LAEIRGSNFEIQTQLVIAKALKFGMQQAHRTADGLSSEVSKMLVALMNKLKK
jgi:four helix bundle protein